MIRRALQVILAVALTSGGAVMAGSTAAQAASYTCAHSQNITVNSAWGVSHVVMTARWQCTDGKFHSSGTLYDDKCDARAGRLAVTANGYYLPDQEYYRQWDWDTNAGNGCGTYSTFSMSEPAVEVSPGAPQGDVKIQVGACNGTSCSNYTSYELLITYTGGGGCIARPAGAVTSGKEQPLSISPC
jgi:hypothetical protein